MMTEDIVLTHDDLGPRRGVLVLIQEVGVALSCRVERQWNRGKSKEIMVSNVTREFALGFASGVIAGVKLENA